MHTKIAIVTTHPIQYNAPWFKLLNEEEDIDIKVFYTWSQSEKSVEDNVFGKTISWDIPLLDGYDYEFIDNVSKNPGTHHKNGIICPTLIERIESFKPEVVLVFGWYLKSHFDVMKHFLKRTQVWFRGDSTLLDNIHPLKKLLRKFYLKYIYNYIDKALYVGTNNKNYFLEYGIKNTNLIFANHAIDNNRFYDDEQNSYQLGANQWREELGLKESDIVILFSGKFQDKKQPLLLVQAVKNVNDKLKKKIKLLLVGDGPEATIINNMIGRDDNIKMLDFQNQSVMPVVYRLSDIFCLPSKGPGETWGLAINEAMACSKPIIASNKVGCTVDLVTKRNGYVFNSDRIEELENIIFSLDKSKLKKMGKESKNIISSWNYKNIVDAIKNNLKKI